MRPHKVEFRATPQQMRLMGYFGQLEAIHAGFNLACSQVEKTIGTPICQDGCGRCCENNAVLAHAVEAEYVASWLVGTRLIKPAMDACEEWLTRPGKWTYGRRLDNELWARLHPEFVSAARSQCPFLTTEKRCMIHYARPLVCRAYGVTHMPGGNCPRPFGVGEDQDTRAWFSPDTLLPLRRGGATSLRELRHKLVRGVVEPEYSQQTFLYTALFQKFRAKRLAALVDEGRVPLVKLHVGFGQGHTLLWQDELERDWKAQLADQAIQEAVTTRDHDGVEVMTLTAGAVR